ncbi:MAG: hypothetical protein HYZ11_04125 [Candidatus Tectomicrobia bacterium]|uniref:Uncharacterized protein n=1 Tax=Tectimicrobiota bacterium TaxID=2528274 RepID=A0A932HXD3_UNCTE|nr:hypothetical protein [Candidatus Tectomicrobia bacterium]
MLPDPALMDGFTRLEWLNQCGSAIADLGFWRRISFLGDGDAAILVFAGIAIGVIACVTKDHFVG